MKKTTEKYGKFPKESPKPTKKFEKKKSEKKESERHERERKLTLTGI